MQKIFVKEMMDKQTVESFFLVREKNLSVGKNGRAYMSLELSDKTGAIDARLWDRVEELGGIFAVGDIIKVKGQIQIFQNRKQFILHKIENPTNHQFDMNDFILTTDKNTEDMFVELVNMVKGLKNEALKQLILDVLEDPEIKPRVLKWPAARSIHHARQGGLLEHILSICKIMDFFAGHYAFLNRDLLIFGAIFHDIGKLWELSIENGVQYTDRGRLIGHMGIACELIDRKSARIMGFTDELRDLCKHIILSHHGKLEYGSPKRPKFIEAMLVAMVDELDSKMDTLHGLISLEAESGEKWSRYNEMFDRYFLLDNLKEKF